MAIYTVASRFSFRVAIVILLAGIIIWFTSCERPEVPPAAKPVVAALDCGTSCTAQKLQLLCDQAQDGDTITIPAGTFNWDAQVNVRKAITIQGQTVVDSSKGTFNDQTKLVDKLPRVSGGQGYFGITVVSGKTTRVTGITFTGVGGITTNMYNGAIRTGGSGNLRIDNCHVDHVLDDPFLNVGGLTRGVMDHCVVNATSHQGTLQFHNGGEPYGDQAWAQDAGFGSLDFFFLEDCWVVGDNHGAAYIDGRNGGKLVVRNNDWFDGGFLDHGTEGNNRVRGARAIDVYNNRVRLSWTTGWPEGIRAGTALVHDNRYSGNRPNGTTMQTYRYFFNFHSSWGGASGDNPWDYNATEADGSHVDGHTPYLFEKGTCTAGSDKTHIVDSTKNWATNKWLGYIAKFPPDAQVGMIQSNTNNTLSVYFYTDSGGGHPWTAGDAYEIRKPIQAIDQTGLGKGDLLDPAISNPPARWLNQKIEGCYTWNNKYTGDNSDVIIGPTTIFKPFFLEGRDYFNGTPRPGYSPPPYPHPLVSGGVVPSPTPVVPTPTASATSSPTATPLPPTPVPSTPTPTGTQVPTATPIPTSTPSPSATPVPSPTVTPAPQFVSWASGDKEKGYRYVYLGWSGSTAAGFDIYRDAKRIATVMNATEYTDSLGKGGAATFVYRVCEIGSIQNCTNSSQVNF